MENKKTKGSIPAREEVPTNYRWKLELMYTGNELWEKDYSETKTFLPEAENLKGTLGKSGQILLKSLQLQDKIGQKIEKLYAYAKMRLDEDTTKETYQALTDRALSLATQAEAVLSYITPEILTIPENTLQNFVAETEELKLYQHLLDEINRRRKHFLSEREEEIISLAGEIMETPEKVYSMLSTADMTFPKVKNEGDEEVDLTHGRYQQFLQSPNREVRHNAFEGMFSSFKKFSNTFNASLIANVKKNHFLTKVRKYPSSLSMSLDKDNISTEVYHNVIETVNKNIAPLHRYVALKKKALKLNKLHFYDLYVPLAQKKRKEYSYKEAKDLVLKALEPMGEEYTAKIKEGLAEGWIDVYENKGKTSGAYSFGTFESPPFILLNYSDTLNDVFTLAHELGHSMHSYYTRKEQPFVYSRYTIFSAEVASTTNEALLVQYLLKVTPPEEKAVIINQYLEGIRATLFRQTLFAEFELKIHEKVENNEGVTAEVLGTLWRDLNNKYYGEYFEVDPLLEIEWARIPHFYYNFYVYKYVTGFAAGTSFAQKILGEDVSFPNKYIDFLKKGSSDYSLNILREAGVDMQSPEPIKDTINIFDKMVSELEKYI